MSQRLIARSPDLKKLQDEGYDVYTRGGNVFLRNVPYLTASQEVKRGVIVAPLALDNDITIQPPDHVVFFAGDLPHDNYGKPIPYVINSNLRDTYGDVEVNHQMSAKPKPADNYRDYYHKMSTYARILTRPVNQVDPDATARIRPVIIEVDEPTAFNYVDNASSRAGLDAITSKLEISEVAIVGMGGTGAYILDLLAKTPVGKIHIYDGDTFHQHNAFRSPGAPTTDDLARHDKKVARFGAIYSAMHKDIVQHAYYVDESTVDELRGMDFVFVAVDSGVARKLIAERLESWGQSFIDSGMGVKEKDGKLTGMVRTTLSTASHSTTAKLSYGGGQEDDYNRNIQIADLNALNAVIAVIKWKKSLGFYADMLDEHHSLYTIIDNYLINTETS